MPKRVLPGVVLSLSYAKRCLLGLPGDPPGMPATLPGIPTMVPREPYYPVYTLPPTLFVGGSSCRVVGPGHEHGVHARVGVTNVHFWHRG